MISSLPKDVLGLLLRKLDVKSLIYISSTNSYFQRVIDEKKLWKYLCEDDFNSVYLELQKESHYETYKYCFCLQKIDKKLNLQTKTLLGFTNGCYIQKNASCIKEIPKEIFLLTTLHELYLCYNEIEEIPKELGMLPNLTVLSLSNNKIKEIPAELAGATTLKRIYLNSNEIVAVPPTIFDMPNLYKLKLKGNPLDCNYFWSEKMK